MSFIHSSTACHHCDVSSELCCPGARPRCCAPPLVTPLDKMLYDDYLCLVESGKQQIKKVGRKFYQKTWKTQLGKGNRIDDTVFFFFVRKLHCLFFLVASFQTKINSLSLLSESGFVLRIAPPPLSRDRRIKMKKSINQSSNQIKRNIILRIFASLQFCLMFNTVKGNKI